MRAPRSTVARFVVAAAIALAARTAGAEYPVSLLHSNANGGHFPGTTLVSDGTWLYGTTWQEGGGTLFKFNPGDANPGTNFQIVHYFTGGTLDGYTPYGDLILNAGILYGTTGAGGTSNLGTVFSLSTSANASTPVTILHSFAGGTSDGSDPRGGVIYESPGILYGTTTGGGNSGFGAVFKVGTDGTAFPLVHSFNGSDGRQPTCSLVLIPGTPGTLYGTTELSNVFSVKTDGSSFHAIKALPPGTSEGAFPFAGLTYDGSKYLYGVASQGGSVNGGTVFRFNKDDDTDANWLLHDFAPFEDGIYPVSRLIFAAGTLYGTAYEGGTGDNGVAFSLSADGSTFQKLSVFTGAPDGRGPFGGLVLVGSTLWGATFQGGSVDKGTIFSLDSSAPNQTPFLAHSFSGGELNDIAPSALVMDAGGNLYGTTAFGGAYGLGSIFKVKSDGTLRILHSFSNTGADGTQPNGELVLVPGAACGTLFGATGLGGVDGQGTIFSISTDDAGTGYAILHDFGFQPTDGYPSGPLTLSGTDLYGTSNGGGSNGMGSVFKLPMTAQRNVDTLTHLYSFHGGDGHGSIPAAKLVIDGTGNIYGTTSGWDADVATVFKIKTDSSIRTLASFGTLSSPSYSYGRLAIDSAGSTLYGVNANGGTTDQGTIFKLSTADATATATIIHNFAATTVDAGGVQEVILGSVAGVPSLIGTAINSGPNSLGSIFSLPLTATTATPLSFIHSFHYGADDVIGPAARPMLDAAGNLWGVSGYGGGAFGAGGTFEIVGSFGTGSGGDGTSDGNCSGGCSLSAPGATPDTRCGPGVVSLTAMGAGSGQTYKWYAVSTGGTALFTGSPYQPTISSTTSFFVAIYDTTTFCESPRTPVTATAIVLPLPPSANSVSRCGTGQVTLTASLAVGSQSYRWYSALTGGLPLSTSNPYQPTISSTTTYYVAIFDPATGCESDRLPVTATVNTLPVQPFVSNSSPACAGATIALATDSVPGASYLWTGPNAFSSTVQNPTIFFATPADAGVYSLTVTVNGCPSPTATTTVAVQTCNASRVFVAPKTGSDASGSLCTDVGQPCKTLAYALSKVDPAGEVILLATGIYDPVTINRSVRIIAPAGVSAFISNPGGSALSVDAASGTVVLRGLHLAGDSIASNGILATNVGRLFVENCTIENFLADGIHFTAPGGTLFMAGDDVRGNAQAGASVSSGGAPARAVIRDSFFAGNATGVLAAGGAIVSVTGSVAASNSTYGFLATTSSSDPAEMTLQDIQALGNGTGADASGASATLRFARSLFAFNTTGVSAALGATALSSATSLLELNATDVNGSIGSVTPK